MAYGRKDYLGTRCDTTLNGAINDSTTSATITSATGWPTVANTGFYAVIDPDSATEEKVFVTARSGTGLTVTRGVDGSTAASHSSGATIRPCLSAVDFDEANYMVAETVGNVTTAGDLLVGSGTNNLTRLAKGSASTILAVDSGDTLSYTTAASAMFADSAVTNAKTAGMTRGTVKVGNSSGAASDLALGTSGKYLKSDGTDASWASMAEWTTSRLGSNQTLTSVTPTQESVNFDAWTTVDGTIYYWETFIVYSGASAGPYPTFRISRDDNTSVYFNGTQVGQFLAEIYFGADIAYSTSWPGNVTVTGTTTGGGKRIFRAQGMIVGNGKGFSVACSLSASGTSPTIYAESYLRYREIT